MMEKYYLLLIGFLNNKKILQFELFICDLNKVCVMQRKIRGLSNWLIKEQKNYFKLKAYFSMSNCKGKVNQEFYGRMMKHGEEEFQYISNLAAMVVIVAFPLYHI